MEETPPRAVIVPDADAPVATEEIPETPPNTGPAPTEVRADKVSDLLGIGKLQLCRKVSGFGSFEPLELTGLKAGQRLLVYCEMTGMQYEAKAQSSFVSRLSSVIEIRSVENSSVLWARALGPAEDECGSRRRDFYVNYRVDLPGSLTPGSYRLRLTQTDLIAGRSTSAEIPLVITP
jgi:hypothetical protein